MHFKDQQIINYFDFLYLKTPGLNVNLCLFNDVYIFKIRRKIKYLRYVYRCRALFIFFIFFTDFIVHSSHIKTIVSLNN